jgi:hypothetical protein
MTQNDFSLAMQMQIGEVQLGTWLLLADFE